MLAKIGCRLEKAHKEKDGKHLNPAVRMYDKVKAAWGKEQAALYQNVLNRAMEDIEQLDGIQCKGLVLKMITGLKQICNHPDNYLKKRPCQSYCCCQRKMDWRSYQQ